MDLPIYLIKMTKWFGKPAEWWQAAVRIGDDGKLYDRRTDKPLRTYAVNSATSPRTTNVQDYVRIFVAVPGVSTPVKCASLKWIVAYGWVPKYQGARPAWVIDHKDGNPTNNDMDNLQCITQSENLLKRRRLSARGRAKTAGPVTPALPMTTSTHSALVVARTTTAMPRIAAS